MLHPRSETDAPGRALLGWACLVAGLGAAPGLAQPTVMWIEEDWEAVLNEPTEDLTAPQFHTVMSPFGDLDSYHFVTTWNYRENPDFSPGGLMTWAWNGETELASKAFREDSLSTAAETIRWTQSLRTTGSQLIFRVLNGQSQTWGAFGGSESRLVESVSVPSLAGYSTASSVKESWITFGANRVNVLRITEVRYYNEDHILVYKDTAPKVVYQLSE